MIRFLDLASQYEGLKPEMDQAIASTLKRATFVGGEPLSTFEREFAAYVGAPHCVGVGNGTDALEIALRCLDARSGGEVIVPANSFIGSAEAVTNAGLRVRFCDVDSTYNLDTEELERIVSNRTVAIMAVHLYGQPADLSRILEIAAKWQIDVVEDCAQAHGATWRGAHVGTQGRIAGFSFYPGKNLGAYGDGGAIVTADPQLARKARMWANHGRLTKYDHEFEGRNSRLDSIQARVLSVKLPHLSNWVYRRREIADIYRAGLEGVGDIRLQRPLQDGESAHHLFPIRTRSRDGLREFLMDEGIETGVHYPSALPDLPAFSDGGERAPRATAFASELLSLPIGDHLRGKDAEVVVSAVKRFFDMPLETSE